MSALVPRPADAAERLARLAPFQRLDRATLEEVGELVRWRALAAGDVLYRQDDDSDSMAFVVEGRLAVALLGGARTEWLRVLGPGAVVGELGMLTHRPRSAHVVATRPSLLAEVGPEGWHRLVGLHAELSMLLLRNLAHQLRDDVGKPGTRPDATVVALVPASRDAPVAQLLHDLAGALPGEVVAVDAAGAEAAGCTTVDGLRSWVDDHEHAGRRVLMAGGEADPEWTARCSAVADAVLLVANPAAAPVALPDAARLQLGPLRTAELVLVHEPSVERPTGTRAWLDRTEVRQHHHVRMQRGAPPTGRMRDDLYRLVRRLTGTAVSVAFGGGAARGLAHIGAVRALEELGVPVDLACGTSMGGIVAAEVALGRTAAELRVDLDPYFSGYFMLRPKLLPVVSGMSDAPLRQLCRTLFRKTAVEDTWRRFFTVASNLGLARAEVMDSGTVDLAVRASGAVPGMWPPVRHDGHLLVDGVVANNLPGDLALRRQPGHVLAVNVIPRQDPLFDGARYRRSAPVALYRRAAPWVRDNPPLVTEIGLRSLFMATIRHAEEVRRQVDVFIEPDVGRFGFLFEAHRGAQIIEAGYRATIDAVSAWLDTSPALPGR